MAAYYNEIDAYAAEWLRNLIKAGHIADGEVDTRSIVDVQPDDLREFTQCHFFAGIAGWSHALRLAGWEDERQIWTGSCPCQPFSVAGQGKGVNDERHLWPHFFRLIRGCRPPVVMGEQVAGAAGYGWLDGVRSDLESESYSIEGVDIPACSINAPHIRQRLYWVANANSGGCREAGERRTLDEIQGRELYNGMPVEERSSGLMDNAQGERLEGRINNTAKSSVETRDGNAGATGCNSYDMANSKSEQLRGGHAREPISPSSSNEGEAQQREWIWSDIGSNGINFWNDAIWLNGADGKTRRAQPDICLLAHGVPARVGKLRAYGNAIVPPLAAEVIKAFMETL